MPAAQREMTSRRRIVVVGTLASNPYAGMAWMHMQIAAGLRRLGPRRLLLRDHLDLAVRPGPADEGVRRLGLRRALPRAGGRPVRPGRPLGLPAQLLRQGVVRDGPGRAEELLAGADAVFNVTGATRLGRGG